MSTITATTADLIAAIPAMFADATKLPEAKARPLYRATLDALHEVEERTGEDLTVARNAVNSGASFHFLGTVGPQSLDRIRTDLAKLA